MLVGRDRELAEIVAALDAAAAGRGRLVLVLGPPGIGKSALVAAALERAPDRGFSVARGYAVDDPGAPPLWPWSRVTRGWTELADQPVADVEEGDAAARFARFVTMADALAERSVRQPLLVVLEDLHWADPQSLQLLRHICGGLAALPLCLLVTARDALAPAALGELAGRDGATTLELVGLSAAHLAQWLPDLDEAGAEQLHERTGGNPLLVRLLGGDHGVDVGAPASGVLRRIAAARLGSLDERARAVVEAAAVVAERVDPGILGVVVGHPVDTELAAAVALGVLRLGADGVSFEHALVRDAVYAQIAVRALGELHRRVAVALAGVPGVPPGPVAVHWQRAAGSDARHECVEWARRADDAARSALAYDDALRYAELAANLVDRPDAGFAPDDCARVLVRLAEAQFLAGRLEACLATCRRAADKASAAGRPDLVARAGLAIVGVGNPEVNTAVASICERALRELPADARAVRARFARPDRGRRGRG